ncbi:MAG: DUF6165 family protein [Pseudomonadota bacterium]
MSESLVSVPVALGELFDKITILQIKRERIADPAKVGNVQRELALLQEVAAAFAAGPHKEPLALLVRELHAINGTLWDLENEVRAFARTDTFEAPFIAAARDIYAGNDRRAAVKRDINRLLGSALVEEKDHSGGRPAA